VTRFPLLRLVPAALALALLSACGADHVYAPDEEVSRAVYVDPTDPPYVTLFTVINNQNDSGAHSGLLINGSQRVLFDPAGTWFSPASPERNDLHYGISDPVLRFYIDYHARVSYRVLEQTLPISQATADALIAAAAAYGSVNKAECAKSISQILDRIPAFSSTIHGTWFPKQLSKEFGRLPGVSEVVVFDNDSNDHKTMLLGNANGAAPDTAIAPTADGTDVIVH
jgi:hypothetical protein